MTDKTPELLPCPFCGGHGMVDSSDDDDGEWRVFWVVCSNCGAEGACRANPTKAVDSWNTRYFGGVEKLSSDDLECKPTGDPS